MNCFTDQRPNRINESTNQRFNNTAPMPLTNRTKIIATLGPASRHPDVIAALIDAGADCFRMNFSHIDGPESAEPTIRMVRQVAADAGRYIPILADIQGPKLRVGKLPAEGVTLRETKPYILTGRDIGQGDETRVRSQYEYLADDVQPGTTIMLADGTIELRVDKIDGHDVQCRVISGGRLFSNKGINIPHTKLSVETLTEKDQRDLQYIAGTDIDLVAISFVRTPEDIRRARHLLGEDNRIPVLAKLELPEVLDNLDAILSVSDGVMVARGDLAVEVPFEHVPQLQKEILQRCQARMKWAIVATQMLGSMVLNKRPSRAEVSDVYNAVLDGADATMLSEETATGTHPTEAVGAMARIAMEAEAALDPDHELNLAADIQSFAAGAAHAAVSAARRLNAQAVIALAGSGLTALALSKWRPDIHILALSMHEATLRRLNVLRGVTPIKLPRRMSMEEQLREADRALQRLGWAAPGEITVAVAAVPLGEHKETNTIRFHHVRDLTDGAND